MASGVTAALALLATIAVLGASAQGAAASDLSAIVQNDCGGDSACGKSGAGSPALFVTLTARPGEQNDFSLSREGAALTVRDASAVIEAGRGCTRVSDHEASCDPGQIPIAQVSVDAGDGDDRFSGGAGPRANLYLVGGPGADVLTGGDGPDAIASGPGADHVNGGGGNDTLIETEPAQTGQPGPEPDMIDGGSGTDRVDYGGRTTSVTVDLTGAPGSSGGAQEGDTLVGIEDADGGSGDDVLIGGDSDNRLTGGAGNDRLQGGGGADWLEGGPGTDRFDGGPGDDDVASHDGSRAVERIACGAGNDEVAAQELSGLYLDESTWNGPDRNDLVGADCEHTSLDRYDGDSDFTLDPRAQLRRGVVRVANPCARAPRRVKCSATISLRRKDRVIATRRVSARGTVTRIPLPRAARAAVLQSRRIGVSILLRRASSRHTAAYTAALSP